MKIYVVDFDIILKNYKNYHESIKLIQSEKQKFSTDVERIKKEMESIINSSKLLIDEKSQMNQAMRFKELQSEAIKLESEFRNDIVQLQNTELEKNFESISEIVEDWSLKNEIDLVINKSQVFFTNPKYDATNDVINLLKEKELFQEFKEEEFLVEGE
jgi:Skp family chaperone for outer membrane proteins